MIDYKPKKPRILFFDLETSPLQAWVWSCGKQVVRHNQLVSGHSRYGIICATYCWNDNKPAKAIDWGYEEQDTSKVVQEFDKLIEQADLVIGKNNTRFDNKMLNAARMFSGLPGAPDWAKYTDDLETQMRRYFRLPSHSLDYISNELGLGGKIKMELQDWIDIVEKNPKCGLQKFNRMLKYGCKDVVDTRSIWDYMCKYFEPRFNAATFNRQKLACVQCGSKNLISHERERVYGKTLWARFKCKDCGYTGTKLPVGQVEKLKSVL